MSDIFISYNHEDQIRAQELAQALGGRGWSIFWDRTIPYGKTWRETIGKELSEARCVIVLWSKTSIESGWVQEEADDAKRRGVLIPIRIDDIKPPIGFRGIQTADLVNWKATRPTPAFERLKTDIAASIGRGPLYRFQRTRRVAPISFPRRCSPSRDLRTNRSPRLLPKLRLKRRCRHIPARLVVRAYNLTHPAIGAHIFSLFSVLWHQPYFGLSFSRL
jgi:TIR domain